MTSICCVILHKFGVPTLDRAIRSVERVVNHIYIGCEPAKCAELRDSLSSYGCTVVPVPWSNDFSAALNRVLDVVSEDWILRLDDDNWLDDNAEGEIRAIADSNLANAYALLVEDQLSATDVAYSYALLLWRNSGLRYRGQVHERLFCNQKNCEVNWAELVNLRINHDGYKDDFARKLSRNRNLLATEAQKDFENEYVRAYLLLSGDMDFVERRQEVTEFLIQQMRAGSPRIQVAEVFARYVEEMVDSSRAHEIPQELMVLARAVYKGRPRVEWAFLTYYEAISDYRAMESTLMNLGFCALVEGIDFSLWMDVEILGYRLHDCILKYLEKLPAIMHTAAHLSMHFPAISPFFETKITGRGKATESLWIEQSDFQAFAQFAGERGFRPSSFQPKSTTVFTDERWNPPGNEGWWEISETVALTKLECEGLMAFRPLFETHCPPVLEKSHYGASPDYKVIETSSRRLRALHQLGEFLKHGPVTLHTYRWVRYVEIRLN
jgi:glycosyltransferase involved in cell wall biosynthesis